MYGTVWLISHARRLETLRPPAPFGGGVDSAVYPAGGCLESTLRALRTCLPSRLTGEGQGERRARRNPSRIVEVLASLALTAVLALGATAAYARNVALLIGVGDYGDVRHNLQGPANDVAALRDVLVRRWGFDAVDVHTLVDAQATREGILAALRALPARTAPGDEVLIYFSGHGTSALDGSMEVPLPHGSGAFIPYGVDRSSHAALARGFIVGRTDLQPLLRALDQTGRRVWVISDSCYSGQQVRSLAPADDEALPTRYLPLLSTAGERQMLERNEARAAERPEIEPYPYRAIAFLAASAEGEVAKDIPHAFLRRLPTVDGRPHGAFTDALLRVLEGRLPADLNRDGRLELNEVHRAVAEFMAARAYGHTPQRLPSVGEDDFGLGVRAVLAARGMAASPPDAPPEPLRVALTPGVVPALRSALDAVPGLQAVTTGDADVVLHASKGGVALRTMGGDLLTELPPAAATGRPLRDNLRQLAWAHRLRQVAERHRRGPLAVEVNPPEFGGNFRVGAEIRFVVRPDREAWLLMLNVDSAGRVSVLYPFDRSELRPLQAGRARTIPGPEPVPGIKVKLPEGMDIQMVFAFDAEPPELRTLLSLSSRDPDDARLARLEPMLAAMAGRYTFARNVLRVSGAPRAARGAEQGPVGPGFLTAAVMMETQR
jgi:hypothetical protein